MWSDWTNRTDVVSDFTRRDLFSVRSTSTVASDVCSFASLESAGATDAEVSVSLQSDDEEDSVLKSIGGESAGSRGRPLTGGEARWASAKDGRIVPGAEILARFARVGLNLLGWVQVGEGGAKSTLGPKPRRCVQRPLPPTDPCLRVDSGRNTICQRKGAPRLLKKEWSTRLSTKVRCWWSRPHHDKE